jgi:hypothetical protein
LLVSCNSDVELLEFVSPGAGVLEALQPHLQRLTRSHDWTQLSAPVRARLLGLIVGDGSVGADVRISLQVGLCVVCMLPTPSDNKSDADVESCR